MAIDFHCSNPKCRRPMQAAETRAGSEVRCEACGQLCLVPAGDGLSISLGTPAKTPLAPGAADESAVPMRPLRSGSVMDCPRCGGTFAIVEGLCPDCGWVNADVVRRRAVPGSAAPDVPPDLSLAECLRSITFGLTNAKSLLVMILVTLVLLPLLGILLLHLFAMETDLAQMLQELRVAFIVISLLDVVVLLYVGGYALRFYLEVILATLVKTGRAPDAPDPSFGRSYGAGCRGLLLMLVYVTPVVTLPLGLLALAHTSDERCLDARWALRIARKHAGKLLLIWVPLALWATLLAVWYVVLWEIEQKDIPILAVAAMTVVAPGVKHLLVCALFRCVGLLGRSIPDFVDTLPKKLDREVMIYCVVIAVSVNCLLWAVVFLLHQ